MKKISIVIPVFNEAETIEQVHAEIRSVCEQNGYQYEIIIVDDGSTDETRDIATRLYPVKYIQLRKNFGQTAALDAGFTHARYGYIVPIDGDGQNDPADIPAMIDFLEKNNLDVVSGWRKVRKDPLPKRIVSKAAHFLRRFFLHDGIHDSGCTLKVYKRECFDHVTLFGEMHRFIPALLRVKGFKVGEIAVHHRFRLEGRTHYDWKRTIKGFLDILSVWFWNKFAVRPLHLLGTIGMLFSMAGLVAGFICIYIFFKGQDLSNTVYPVLSAFLLIMGIQLFVMGLMADILSKTYYETTKDVSYTISRIFENTGDGSTVASESMDTQRDQKP